MTRIALIEEMSKCANKEKAQDLQRFFKTAKGEYAEGDIFIGISVPVQRNFAKKYKILSIDELEELLHSPIHEHRLTALFILIIKFEKGDDVLRKQIFNLYMSSSDYVNNWDLVDSSAHKIVGPYLYERDFSVLYEWAESGHLWKQRISMMTTYYFIKKHDFKIVFDIATILLHHKHDLIHKIVGWMLREVGKINYQEEYEYLQRNYSTMPRTMLRYAIEKFDEDVRQDFLKGRIT